MFWGRHVPPYGCIILLGYLYYKSFCILVSSNFLHSLCTKRVGSKKVGGVIFIPCCRKSGGVLGRRMRVGVTYIYRCGRAVAPGGGCVGRKPFYFVSRSTPFLQNTSSPTFGVFVKKCYTGIRCREAFPSRHQAHTRIMRAYVSGNFAHTNTHTKGTR